MIVFPDFKEILPFIVKTTQPNVMVMHGGFIIGAQNNMNSGNYKLHSAFTI